MCAFGEEAFQNVTAMRKNHNGGLWWKSNLKVWYSVDLGKIDFQTSQGVLLYLNFVLTGHFTSFFRFYI